MTTLIIVASVVVALIPIGFAIYYVDKTCKNNWYIYFNKKKQKGYIRDNAKAERGQIVMLGDSIIDMYDTKKYLADARLIVYNRGISGDTSLNVLNRLESNALTIEPSTLFLLVGTNDIYKGISHDESIAYITEILTKVKEHHVDNIYVESLYPVNASVNKEMVDIRTNEMICALNTRLEALCNEMGVTYINVHDALTDEAGAFKREYTVDGLHPNAQGYEIVTSIVLPYIR